jgi:hypothetical protein
MGTIKLTGHVDEQHQLRAEVPDSVRPGPVEVVILLPSVTEDDAGAAWMAGIAQEWIAELSDPREDLYALADGEPVDGSR